MISNGERRMEILTQHARLRRMAHALLEMDEEEEQLLSLEALGRPAMPAN